MTSIRSEARSYAPQVALSFIVAIATSSWSAAQVARPGQGGGPRVRAMLGALGEQLGRHASSEPGPADAHALVLALFAKCAECPFQRGCAGETGRRRG